MAEAPNGRITLDHRLRVDAASHVLPVHLAENVSVTAMPTLGILAAPASLSLVGYISLVDDPQPLPVVLLIGIAVLTSIVYVAFTRLLVLPFSPAYAAYTFPIAIGATALFKTVGQLEAWQIRQQLIDQLHGLALRVAGRHRGHRLYDVRFVGIRRHVRSLRHLSGTQGFLQPVAAPVRGEY